MWKKNTKVGMNRLTVALKRERRNTLCVCVSVKGGGDRAYNVMCIPDDCDPATWFYSDRVARSRPCEMGSRGASPDTKTHQPLARGTTKH